MNGVRYCYGCLIEEDMNGHTMSDVITGAWSTLHICSPSKQTEVYEVVYGDAEDQADYLTIRLLVSEDTPDDPIHDFILSHATLLRGNEHFTRQQHIKPKRSKIDDPSFLTYIHVDLENGSLDTQSSSVHTGSSN